MHERSVGFRLSLAFLLSLVVTTPLFAVVERYKNEAAYLARIAGLGYGTVSEGFESSVWDGVRSNYPVMNSQPSVTSQQVTWEAAGLDLWNYQTSRIHGVTTNNNWARTGSWGIFEDHVGDPIPTTIRVRSSTPMYAIGGWFDTNPDGQSVGFLFEGRTTANDPGYVLPGFGAMYPGDNPSIGHEFVGIVDPDGFDSVVLTGTLELNAENQLEGGTIFGADDFSLGIIPQLLGDYNQNDVVDAADYTTWRDSVGAPAGTLPNDGDGGVIGQTQFDTWKANFGQTIGVGNGAAAGKAVPEPTWQSTLLIGALALLLSRCGATPRIQPGSLCVPSPT